MKNVQIKNGSILLGTHWEDRHLAGGLPGARWAPREKCWKVPATPACAGAVCRAFGEEEVRAIADDGFCELLAKRDRRRQVRERHGNAGADYIYHTEPWGHQVGATRFARDMDVALLHCWMGAGKTKVTLDAAHARGHRTVLVICPKSVITVWQKETQKHALGDTFVLRLVGDSVVKRAARLKRELRRWEIDEPDMMLMAVVNYEATWREPLAKVLLGHEWDLIVFDESQRIKSPGSKQGRFAARLKAKHKLALTGTPMSHSPLDLYGQYRALDPGIFGTRFTRFRARYAVMGGFEGRQVLGFQNEDELKVKMDRICYHVPKDALDLPRIQFDERYCTLDRQAARIYKDLEKAFIAEVEDGIVTAANALAKLLRLQQVAAGFVKTEDGRIREVGKAKERLLTETLEDIGGGERVVVFCRFRHDLDTVRRVAEKLDRGGLHKTCGEISGRVNEYEEWKRGEFSTLAVQIQAGGLGIDLTEARYVIYFTLGFSLGDYQQSVARVHRPGQEHPVQVYRLVTEGTVDRKIIKALDAREDVIRLILEEVGHGNGRRD